MKFNFDNPNNLINLSPEARLVLEDLYDLKQPLELALREIIKDKPDEVIFLDKGARIFAVPFMKALKILIPNDMPKIAFVNDGKIKMNRWAQEEQIQILADKILGRFYGKKVIFIDETISSGLGVSILLKFQNQFKSFKYIALSQNPNIEKPIPLDIRTNPNVVIAKYENVSLFSKMLSKLYITDNEDDETIHISKKQRPKSEIKGNYKMLNIVRKITEDALIKVANKIKKDSSSA